MWLEQVVRWEQGAAVDCPYDVPGETITLASVKKELAEEEHQREVAGENPSNSTSTLSGLIIKALEIEEVQRSLSMTVNGRNKLTPLQEQGIQVRRTSLLQRIRRFRDALLVHIPSLRRLIEAEPASEFSQPETMKLFIPSSLSASLRATILPLEDKIEVRIKGLTATYRAAWAALVETRGEGDWMRHLKVLRDDDIRGISERVLKDSEKEDYRRAQEQAGISAEAVDDILENGNAPTKRFNPVLSLGQSKYVLSWIWYTHSSVVGTNEVGQGSSFEEIIDSEPSYIILMDCGKANWWEGTIGKRTGLTPWLEEGLSAYASERARHWSSVWFTVRERAKAILRYVTNPLSDALMPAMPELEVEVELENEEDEYIEGDFDG
ncbi:hypothetical protein PQX77_021830 [Marasmius sp. AFHP31]|nr:hypothetical protein PQX77_021830 [Marasmius sp. AFHP31]